MENNLFVQLKLLKQNEVANLIEVRMNKQFCKLGCRDLIEWPLLV